MVCLLNVAIAALLASACAFSPAPRSAVSRRRRHRAVVVRAAPVQSAKGPYVGHMDNPDNIEVGDAVRVKVEGETLRHVARMGPFDPNGREGVVWKFSTSESSTAPCIVKCAEPDKFVAHFTFDELERV